MLLPLTKLRLLAVAVTALAALLLVPVTASALPAADGWEEAKAAFQANDFERAVAGFRAGAEAQPDQPSWHYMLGLSLSKAGRPDEAVPALQRAVALTAESGGDAASYALPLAQAQRRAGDLGGALETLDRHRPDTSASRLHEGWVAQLAATAARMSDPQPAIPLLAAAAEAAPGRSDLRLALGRAYDATGDLEAAFRHYAAATEDPQALRAALETAFAAADAVPDGDTAARAEWYRRAADAAAGTPPADLPVAVLLAAGDALLLADRPAEAESRFRTALEQEPGSALASYQLARCRLARDDAAGALDLLVGVLAGGPEGDLARRAFAAQAQALAELERWKEAAAAYRRAGDEGRATEMEAVVEAIRHNEEVDAAAAECRRRWAQLARLRAENRDVKGTEVWDEIERRAEQLEAECGPEPVATAEG